LFTCLFNSFMQTWTHYVQVPIFYNLTQMELFSNLEGKSWPKKWMWKLEMLQNSPKLQHLIIYEISHIISSISSYLFCLTLPLHILTLVSCFGRKFTYCLQEIENRIDDDDDILEDPKIVPECLSSKLKTCLFKNYWGKRASICRLCYAQFKSINHRYKCKVPDVTEIVSVSKGM